MILRQLSRQQFLLRPVLYRVKYSPPIFRKLQSRKYHAVPDLSLRWDDNGIKQERKGHALPVVLYSKKGYILAWGQYQSLLLDWINERTKGTPDEFVDGLKGLVFKYSRNPAKAALFNHASMAINNEFFFRGMTDNPAPPGNTIRRYIEDSFSSLDSFREEFLATAKALFGGGFVWLVQDRSTENMRILATYNAGTPYREAHVRQQIVDMSNHKFANAEELRRMTNVNNSTGFHGRHWNEGRSLQSEKPGHMGYNCEPLLCANVWQYAYLQDWGHRKNEFLDEWWNFIDWRRVERLSIRATQTSRDRGRLTQAGWNLNHNMQRSFNQR